jgi:regulator of cell morphogenesis and NO signaling
MKNKEYRTMKVGDIVAKDFRTADIFKKAGIDFCCGGFETLDLVCQSKKVSPEDIEKELTILENTPIDPAFDFANWKLDALCDHIVNKHHKTVLELLPQLTFYTQKIADVHGEHHPELIEISKLFSKVDIELRQHLQRDSQDSKFVTHREIMIMKTEHEYAGSVLDNIKELSMNYAVPRDACTTYQLTYKLLEQFEDDLHIHVHLENNILYPKALELAK